MKEYVATSMLVMLGAVLSFAAGVWYGEGDTIYIQDDYVQDDSLLSWKDGWLTIQSEVPEGVVFKTRGTYSDGSYVRWTGFELSFDSGVENPLLCDGLDCTESQ